MKKFMTTLAFILFMIVSDHTAFAKSYTIDDIQIRGWIQPNGDILVNEIFTYSFDGEYSELLRSFPEKHIAQIEQFEAYIVSEKHPKVGEIKGEHLTQIPVKSEGQTLVAEIGKNNKKISVFYLYYLRDAVKSYDTYSDLSVTYFEDGSNHDIDFKNVNISYVLPDEVGEESIYGFMGDRNGRVQKIHRNGIVFETPQSTASTETSTRVLFLSEIMTAQEKKKAPASLAAVVKKEEKDLQVRDAKLGKIPLVSKVAEVAGLIFLLLSAIMLLLLPQRWFFLRGKVDEVLKADPVYLFFIDQNGEKHPKSFLAGLLSMSEKKYVDVSLEPIAERYKEDPGVGENTLSFQLNKSDKDLLTYEKSLVSWLFKLKPGSERQTFHLHDVAGIPKEEVSEQMHYVEAQKEFKKKQDAWHQEVNKLLKEASTYTDLLPKIIKVGVLGILLILMIVAYYVDLQNGGILIIFLVTVVSIGIRFTGASRKRWIVPFYFIFLLSMTGNIIDDDLGGSLTMMFFGGILLYFVTPNAIITSIYALNIKRGIRSFRAQVKRGLPRALSKEEQSQWLTRAYILNKSKVKLPFTKEDLPSTLPLAAMFSSGIDPFYFVLKSWKRTKKAASTGGGSHYGGYGGGDSGGGGGAGAR